MAMRAMAPANLLAGLRVRASAVAPAPPPPPLVAAAQQPHRGAAGAASSPAGAHKPLASASLTGRPRGPAGNAGGADPPLAQTVAQLLEGGKPAVAAHLVLEEWQRTGQQLKDETLSKELVMQLLAHAGSETVLQALPAVSASPALCAAAIRALQERRNLRGVRAVLRHARDCGAARGPEGRDVWRAAIVALGALRRPREARQAFADMRAAGAWELTDTPTVNLLLNALHSDVGLQFVRANQLRREGLAPDASTFNALLKGCMRARDVRRAELALRWMAADGVAADEVTYNTLIKTFQYAGDFERVLATWKRMPEAGFTPAARLWGSLLLACGAAGQLEQCHIFWWEMRQLHAQGGREVLNNDSVCAMMTACNDAGQYERALSAFAEARGAGVALDTRAYNIALRACLTPGKTPRPEQLLQAFALFDELKRAGLSPDAFTFGTLFTLCAAARQGRVALQLYEEMRALGVQENVVAMTALIKAVGATPGMAADASALFKRMSYGPARVKPNRATFRTMIGALREQGDLAGALRVYEGMRRLHPADNSEFEGLTAVAAERALSAEDADLRAAVAAVCGITSPRCVDLHGMSVLEARAAVLCTLAMLQQQHRDEGAVGHDVTLITGRGAGSAGGEPVVRLEVLRLLGVLLPPLPPEATEANPGRIVIPRRLLCEAMAAKTAARASHQLQQQQQQAQAQALQQQEQQQQEQAQAQQQEEAQAQQQAHQQPSNSPARAE